MEVVQITYRDNRYEMPRLSTTLDFIKKYKLSLDNPIAAVMNGHLTRLNKEISINSYLEIIELSSGQGRRFYESSILFLFVVAFTKKYPDLQVFIQHSIQKGIYAEINGQKLSEKEIKELEKYMLEMAERDLPIRRITRDLDIALDKMESVGRKDIVNLYRYYTPGIFKLYELDGVEESLYLPLVPSTKILKYFKLIKYHEGVVIVLPDFNVDNKVPNFVDRPNLFETYQEYHRWSRILKVRTVGQLNRYIMDGEIKELVKVVEALHEKRVAHIADQITNKKVPRRLVLIAGPTSSGKTTFSKRLSVQLRVNGFSPIAISMDNYFVDRDKTPKRPDGEYDFEALEAIDVKLFMEHLEKLLNGEEIEIPHFDFPSGTRKSSGKKLRLENDQIIIIEGIHGINPQLTSRLDQDQIYKIYIAPLTQLNLHRHDRIPASDTRLIRRIVRDSFFRGYSASETLKRWSIVREAEKKNLFPLQEEVDIIFNSAIFYELSVLKIFAERELLRVTKDDPMYTEARRLLKFLSFFLPLHYSQDIPSTSILKEFIGGSAFEY